MSRWPNYSRNAYRLRDCGHNHQGVNSPADRKSLLKQTEELDSQSSSEDFGFEPEPRSPRLRGNSRDRLLGGQCAESCAVAGQFCFEVSSPLLLLAQGLGQLIGNQQLLTCV